MAKKLVKRKLTAAQKKFIERLEDLSDLPLVMNEQAVSEPTIQDWLKQRVEFKERFFKAINLSENQWGYLKVLAQYRGNISRAASVYGISARTVRNWKNQSDEFNALYMDIKESVKDHVEDKLHQNIDKNDTTAIIFFLKTQCKDRGYVEKTELDLTPSISKIKKLSDEELDKQLAELDAEQKQDLEQ